MSTRDDRYYNTHQARTPAASAYVFCKPGLFKILANTSCYFLYLQIHSSWRSRTTMQHSHPLALAPDSAPRNARAGDVPPMSPRPRRVRKSGLELVQFRQATRTATSRVRPSETQSALLTSGRNLFYHKYCQLWTLDGDGPCAPHRLAPDRTRPDFVPRRAGTRAGREHER